MIAYPRTRMGGLDGGKTDAVYAHSTTKDPARWGS